MMRKVPFQVSSLIKAASNKALQQCGKYVVPTLKHDTRRILLLLAPREASKMDTPAMFPWDDFGMDVMDGCPTSLEHLQ
jgi:hypothetical protein